jgi:hypothetical protein
VARGRPAGCHSGGRGARARRAAAGSLRGAGQALPSQWAAPASRAPSKSPGPHDADDVPLEEPRRRTAVSPGKHRRPGQPRSGRAPPRASALRDLHPWGVRQGGARGGPAPEGESAGERLTDPCTTVRWHAVNATLDEKSRRGRSLGPGGVACGAPERWANQARGAEASGGSSTPPAAEPTGAAGAWRGEPRPTGSMGPWTASAGARGPSGA